MVLTPADISHADDCTDMYQLSNHPLSQGRYVEADSFYLRAIEIQAEMLGPDHPELAKTLNNQANLFRDQVSSTGVLVIIEFVVVIANERPTLLERMVLRVGHRRLGLLLFCTWEREALDGIWNRLGDQPMMPL